MATNGSTEPDMFKHMDSIKSIRLDEDLNDSGDRRIEYSIEEEDSPDIV